MRPSSSGEAPLSNRGGGGQGGTWRGYGAARVRPHSSLAFLESRPEGYGVTTPSNSITGDSTMRVAASSARRSLPPRLQRWWSSCGPGVPSGGPGETRASASHDVRATRPRGTPAHRHDHPRPVLPTRVTGVLQPPSRPRPSLGFRHDQQWVSSRPLCQRCEGSPWQASCQPWWQGDAATTTADAYWLASNVSIH